MPFLLFGCITSLIFLLFFWYSFAKFIEFKNEFTKINNALKNKLNEFSKQRKIFDDIKSQKKKNSAKNISKDIEEKLRSKKKLTTEDLLMLQEAEK